MSKRKLPKHIKGTIKQWRRDKRYSLSELMYWLKDLSFGCAYTPIYKEISEMRNIAEQCSKKLSQNEWGK